MMILLNILIGLFSAILGTWIGTNYIGVMTNRQEKALLVLLIQEFILFLRCSTGYYEQFLKAGVSYTVLVEATDASTLTKLAEVTKNSGILETVLNLRADFFQVSKYAQKASEARLDERLAEVSGDRGLAERKSNEARSAQELALLFLIGDQIDKDGFARKKYPKYIENLQSILDHLENLNTASGPMNFLVSILPELRSERLSLNRFIAQRKKELGLIREKIGLLREIERLVTAA